MPDPVWNVSTGNWSSHRRRPPRSRRGRDRRRPRRASITPRLGVHLRGRGLDRRRARGSAPARRCGPDTGKFSTARCVCAPHRAAAGTRTSPIVSCSTRNSSSAMPPRYAVDGSAADLTPGRLASASMTDLAFTELLPLGPDDTPYRLLTTDGVSTVEAAGRTFLQVEPEVLTAPHPRGVPRHRPPAAARPPPQLRRILDDPEASANDRFVALDLLKNANIAAGGVLPDVPGHRHRDRDGQEGRARAHRRRRRAAPSAAASSRPTRRRNLRYSQMAPLTMWDEVNTGTNLPAQIELYATDGRRLQAPVHGQGRRLGQQELPVPGDQGAPEPLVDAAGSSTRSCARSAPSPARRTTSPWSSAARRPSSR